MLNWAGIPKGFRLKCNTFVLGIEAKNWVIPFVITGPGVYGPTVSSRPGVSFVTMSIP